MAMPTGVRSPTLDKNLLYYGDNLDILRRYIPNESVDLIYLDPPFQKGQRRGEVAGEQEQLFEPDR